MLSFHFDGDIDHKMSGSRGKMADRSYPGVARIKRIYCNATSACSSNETEETQNKRQKTFGFIRFILGNTSRDSQRKNAIKSGRQLCWKSIIRTLHVRSLSPQLFRRYRRNAVSPRNNLGKRTDATPESSRVTERRRRNA